MSLFPVLDQFNFHHVLAEQPGASLVVFGTRACASCKHWRLVLSEYRMRHGDVAIFEVDAERDLALTREFAVFHLPALFLFRNGHYHGAVQCEARVAKLHAALQTLLTAPAEEAP